MGHLIINSHKHTEHTAWANQYQALRVRTPRRFFECIFLHFKCRCRQYILRKLDAALLISIKFNAKNIIITLINLIFLCYARHLKIRLINVIMIFFALSLILIKSCSIQLYQKTLATSTFKM